MRHRDFLLFLLCLLLRLSLNRMRLFSERAFTPFDHVYDSLSQIMRMVCKSIYIYTVTVWRKQTTPSHSPPQRWTGLANRSCSNLDIFSILALDTPPSVHNNFYCQVWYTKAFLRKLVFKSFTSTSIYHEDQFKWWRSRPKAAFPT